MGVFPARVTHVTDSIGVLSPCDLALERSLELARPGKAASRTYTLPCQCVLRCWRTLCVGGLCVRVFNRMCTALSTRTGRGAPRGVVLWQG